VRIKLLCRQILNQLLGRDINYDKIQKLTTGKRLSFEPSDVKAMIAAIDFIFSNAAKYDVDSAILPVDLQQLGLPADVVRAMVKEYVASKENLRAYFATQTLTLPRVTKVDWRVDYVVSSNLLQTVNIPSIRMNMELSKPSDFDSRSSVAFEMTADKFRALYSELKAARALMDGLET